MNKLLLFSLACATTAFPMETVKKELIASGSIVGASIAGACLYGIANDQITARICPEYFTKGFHKRMMDHWNTGIHATARSILEKNTESPTVIGLVWGPIATWWVGAALGIPAAFAARVGSHNQMSAQDLIKPMAVALALTGAGAAIEGYRGYKKVQDPQFVAAFSQDNPLALGNFYKDRKDAVSDDAVPGFIINAFAHQAAYKWGALSGLGLIGYIIHQRITK